MDCELGATEQITIMLFNVGRLFDAVTCNSHLIIQNITSHVLFLDLVTLIDKFGL